MLILIAIDPSLYTDGLLPTFIGNRGIDLGSGIDGLIGSGNPNGRNYVSKADLQKVIERLNREAIIKDTTMFNQMKTVQTLFIETHRK